MILRYTNQDGESRPADRILELKDELQMKNSIISQHQEGDKPIHLQLPLEASLWEIACRMTTKACRVG